MIFEDVHWSDPTTRELLDLLVERVPKVRLLVLITYRPEFSPAWVGLPHVSLLTLSRLPRHSRGRGFRPFGTAPCCSSALPVPSAGLSWSR